MGWWMTSRARVAFWALVAFDNLYGYIARDTGLFGTVWEQLVVATIALFALWEALEDRARARQVSR